MKNFINRIFKYKDNKKILNIFICILGSVLYTIGIKWFIIPAHLKTGGFTGMAQIIYGFISDAFDGVVPNDVGVSILWFILNIPVFFLGFKTLGRRFALLSFLSVICGMLTLALLPVPEELIKEKFFDELMLSAIIGGVITGLGVGITLKVGSSTGGMDIISQYLSFKRDRSFGQYSFYLNAIIITIVGITDSWVLALYTIINLFISIIVIDKIHTRHNKLTLMIVTDYKDEMIAAIHKRIYRGITVIPAMGAYHRKDKSVLFMVVSSYELYNVVATIKDVDEKAFTNVIKSQMVFGNFVKQKIG
ncbi:YitT family protein [Mycoplasmatota bacterium]|nr:YitT family protein [Mycoplasmatota bacterium]